MLVSMFLQTTTNRSKRGEKIEEEVERHGQRTFLLVFFDDQKALVTPEMMRVDLNVLNRHTEKQVFLETREKKKIGRST